jgi:hypothetical protein
MMRGLPKTGAALRRLIAVAWPAVFLLLTAGCAVRAYQREHLVDPIMSFEAESRAAARRIKAMDAREGSTGGAGGAGGGCACN